MRIGLDRADPGGRGHRSHTERVDIPHPRAAESMGSDAGWPACGESMSYSSRKASIGFTPEARCAGMSAAPIAAEQRIRIAIAITAGSEGFTS